MCVVSFSRSMQEVHLDKHVKLLDSPGIVMDSGNSDSAVILRNCVKVQHENIMITKDVTCILIYQQWLNFTLMKGHLYIQVSVIP